MDTKQIVINHAICFVTATSATYVGARYLTNVNPKIAVVAAATISVVRIFTFPLVQHYAFNQLEKHRQLTAGDIFKRRVPAIALALFTAAIVPTALFRVSIKISLLISTGVIFFTSIPWYIGILLNINNRLQHHAEKDLNKVEKMISNLPERDNSSELNKLNDAKKQIEARIQSCKIVNESTFSPLHYVVPQC